MGDGPARGWVLVVGVRVGASEYGDPGRNDVGTRKVQRYATAPWRGPPPGHPCRCAVCSVSAALL